MFRNRNLFEGESDKLRRRYRAFQIGFFVMLGIMGFTVYANFDYWVFKTLIANNYVFTSALDELYSRHILEENRRNGFRRDFDRVVISIVTAELSEINNDRHTYLYAPQEIQHVRQTDRAVARTANIEKINDETVYLFIPNISRITREFVQRHSSYLAQYDNLVLDLRGNYGGWLADFHRIADLFVPSGAVLSHEETRLALFTRTITSSGDAYFDFDNVVILQNRRTASAAEGLIMALSEHVPNVTTVGQTTFGKGTGQVTVPLTGGYAVRATVLRVLGPQGQCIHNVGVEPDIEMDMDADKIEKALEIISSSYNSQHP
ncbi:MAG: S41 family peptidase [Defluviitaleaceae bacterium]|nr:S41 family peptidase [Defluviitaleaceae bacterium]